MHMLMIQISLTICFHFPIDDTSTLVRKKISHRKGNRSLAETNEGDPVDWRNVESLVMEILIF